MTSIKNLSLCLALLVAAALPAVAGAPSKLIPPVPPVAGDAPIIAPPVLIAPPPKAEKVEKSDPKWNESEYVFTGKLNEVVAGPVGQSYPPMYTHTLRFTVEKVLRGGLKQGAGVDCSHVARQLNAPTFPEGRVCLVAAKKSQGGMLASIVQEADEAAVAAATASCTLPLGWKVEGGKPISPWASMGTAAWPAGSGASIKVKCEKTGRPALMAGSDIAFTVESVPPAKDIQWTNPDGDGEYKVTVKNTTDKPVRVPALLTDGKNILWDESLVILCQGKVYTCPGSKGVSGTVRTAEIPAGGSVSSVVNVFRLKGPEWPQGGYRIEFQFCLGEKSQTKSFYYMARHHDKIRDAAQAAEAKTEPAPVVKPDVEPPPTVEPKPVVEAKPITEPGAKAPGGEKAGTPAEQLKKSLETWQDLKAKCGGNYCYSVGFQSWVGFGNSTEIVVRDNKVVERKYSEFNRNAPPAPAAPGKEPKLPGENWTEKGEELGSHKKGAPPKTLDDLYQEAQKIVEKKLAPEQRLYVTFDKQGLLQSCFYVDTRIMDDAPRTGVAIGNIRLEMPTSPPKPKATLPVVPDIAPAAAAPAAPSGKLAHDVYSGYFVSNKFEPKAPESFLVISDKAGFDKVFGAAFVMGDKSHRLAPNTFESQVVLAAIRRGNAFWTYAVEGVAEKGGTVELRYKATDRKSETATFACPLIVSVPKGKYQAVQFIENGKPVKKLDLGKGEADRPPE